ncbi:hypothetical protein KKA53_03865 [Candidatus Dependentiae bacterium]|nr:hypothetical protein [Candidatus Dependentiae bacterium]
MKKSFIRIAVLFAILITSTNHTKLFPIIYTNKTYMAIPTPHYYLPMKYTSWHRILKQGSKSEKPWENTLLATPFYHNSNNEGKLGKYFGTNFKSKLKVSLPSETTDLQSDNIMHRYDDFPSLDGTLCIKPSHTTYGIYLSYNQELSNIHKGLFLRVNIPFEHVENDLHATATQTKHLGKGILDFFSGAYSNVDPNNLQDALTHAKICGSQGKSGIADIELLLGYKLAEKKEHEISGSVKLIIPTGGRPQGEYLFESVVGNGKHWGIGTNLNASMNIVKNETSSLECLIFLEYTYLFKSDEKRTLGFRNGTGLFEGHENTPINIPWFYYILGGEIGKMGTFPLANILTQEVSVTPGGKSQGHASFAYHRNNTTIDFGYSFYAQEGERVALKSCWNSSRYAPANPSYQTTAAFDVSNTAHSAGQSIKEFELDTSVPETPAFLKHAFHGAISYTHSEWENPFMLGCGFSVDWTHDNANPVGYTLWLKAGATF